MVPCREGEAAGGGSWLKRTRCRAQGPVRPSFYYGWVSLGVAALAMVATLPGRTQGLGLVTEPLMRDLGIGRVAFAEVNLVATLVGSLFCLGIGRLIDRVGQPSRADGGDGGAGPGGAGHEPA